jgi:hypothetical protein
MRKAKQMMVVSVAALKVVTYAQIVAGLNDTAFEETNA